MYVCYVYFNKDQSINYTYTNRGSDGHSRTRYSSADCRLVRMMMYHSARPPFTRRA